MSFGGSQGIVRYAVMLQDQVSVPAQKISNEFRNMGTSMTTLTQKANVFNNSIMSNTRAFTASVTPIKNSGNALNQLGVQQKTIGSQLASIGSGFKNNALAIGAAASSVLGLYQNYANLSSAQNNANKSATAAKAAQNNLAKAQDNLAKTIAKYGANSKEAKAAQDKLTVAQERAVNKTESAKIAQDNLNQTMADFGINILPNVVLAGGSFTDILSNMTAKSAGGVSAMTKLKEGFLGIGSAITTKAAPALTNLVGLLGVGGLGALGGSALISGVIIDQVQKMGDEAEKAGVKFTKMRNGLLFSPTEAIQGFKEWDELMHATGLSVQEMQTDWDNAVKKFVAAGGKLDKTGNIIFGSFNKAQEAAAKAKAEIDKLPPSMDKAATSADAWVNMMIKALQSSDPAKIIEFNKAFKESGQPVERYTQILNEATAAINASQQAAAAAAKPVKTLAENWKLQSQSLQGGTVKNLNLASGAYLDVHNTIVKTNPVIQENITKTKEQNEMQIQMAKALKNTTPALSESAQFTKLFGDKTTIAADAMADFNQKANDATGGMDSYNKAIQDGVDQANEFIVQMELGAVTNETFNTTLAASARNLGIHTNLLAFSSTKMQELIKTTYDQTTAFNAMQMAAAKSTDFLKDQTLIQAQVNAGMLDGTIAANDWAISMFKDVAQAKALHDQTAILAQTMGIKLPQGIQLTTEQLHTVMQAFRETGSAAFTLDKIINEKVRPSFEHFGDIFSATSWKEFKSSWKDLQKSGSLQGIPKDLRNSLKDLGQDLISVNKHAKEATNVIDALLVSAFSNRQKGTKSGLKALLDDIKSIPGADKITPFKDAMKDLIALPKDERTQALKKYTDAFAAYKDAVKKDSPGGTIITSGEAENINALTKAAQQGSGPLNTYSGSIDTYAASLLKLAETNFDPTKFTKSLTPKGNPVFKSTDPSLFNKGGGTQKTIITADNHQALAAVDAVAKRIASLSGIKAMISLVNNTAIKAVDTIAKRINSLTGINPTIPVNNKQALKAIDAIAKRIDSLSKINPQIPVNNKPAIKAVDAIAKRIDGLSKINPDIKVNNKPAIKAIDVIAKRITSLPTGDVTVKVHYDTSGKPPGIKAQHGFHGTLIEDTTILAHKGERVDIGRANSSGETRPSSSGGGGSGFGAGGNLTVNNVIDLGGDRIVRSFKRRLGNDRYVFGA